MVGDTGEVRHRRAWVLCALFVYCTRAGLRVRATGESLDAARAAGIAVGQVQTLDARNGGPLTLLRWL